MNAIPILILIEAYVTGARIVADVDSPEGQLLDSCLDIFGDVLDDAITS
jgi:hypothetical protein